MMVATHYVIKQVDVVSLTTVIYVALFVSSLMMCECVSVWGCRSHIARLVACSRRPLFSLSTLVARRRLDRRVGVKE